MRCRNVWALKFRVPSSLTREPPNSAKRLRSRMLSRLPLSPIGRKRVIFFLVVVMLAAGVRLLTFNFVRAHLNDPAWFQSGSYRVFDKRAGEILDGTGGLFWIDDPARTDLIQYPPAYPWLVAVIYRLTGQRSASAVQSVQAVLDLTLSMILVTGLAGNAYGWPHRMAARHFAP